MEDRPSASVLPPLLAVCVRTAQLNMRLPGSDRRGKNGVKGMLFSLDEREEFSALRKKQDQRGQRDLD